jgi:hypothetical protein
VQGEIMAVVPLSKAANVAANSSSDAPRSKKANSIPWIRYAAACTLATSGALLVTGKRRAGLATALTGTVLAMLDQQDVVSAGWNALPGYLEEIQGLLSRAQTAVEDLSAQGQKLRSVLGR